jgi:hypothetical protein
MPGERHGHGMLWLSALSRTSQRVSHTEVSPCYSGMQQVRCDISLAALFS